MRSAMDEWVNDELHSILGMSDRTLTQFMIALAKKSSSSSDLIEKIQDTGTLEIDSRVERFAQGLFQRIPRVQQSSAGPKVSAQRLKEEAALARQKWNDSFKLLSDPESDDEPSTSMKKRHLRKRSQEEEDSEEETSGKSKSTKSKRNVKFQDFDEEDELDKIERERDEDIQARDALSKRLREKDKERTRNIVEKTDKKSFEEAARRLKLEEEDRKAIVPRLREVSRREYLKKREDDKVDELEADIKDDEYIFAGERYVHE